jgi:hypothetical protein
MIFDFAMVGRKCTLNFDFWSFPGLATGDTIISPKAKQLQQAARAG